MVSDNTTHLNIRVDKDIPNDTTAAAIAEGRRIAADKSRKGYSNINDLETALYDERQNQRNL